MNQRTPLLWFLLMTFGISWPLFLLPLAMGEPGTSTRQIATQVFWALAMWGPGIAALITTLIVQRKRLSTLNLGGLGPNRFYLVAWLLPPLLAVLAGVLTWLSGVGVLDLSFPLIREAFAQAPEAPTIPVNIIVIIQVATALTIGTVFNLFFTMGEELGWRGFLLPQLLPLGQWRAILLSSAIWGIWHAPVIAQGHNYPGRPVLGIFLMIGWCLMLGILLSWLYLRTRSPWAPALAHASINATAALPLLFFRDVDVVLGGTTASLIGWIGSALLVGWLIATRRVPVAFTAVDVPNEQESQPLQPPSISPEF